MSEGASIVVCERGFVLVGVVETWPEGGDMLLRNASVIRRWGTTDGLGQLVDGPMSNTKLDPIRTPGNLPVRVVGKAILYAFPVSAEAWKLTDARG